MPYFNNPKTNETFEVSEEHAEMVLRPQGIYEETVAPVAKPKPVVKKKAKKNKDGS